MKFPPIPSSISNSYEITGEPPFSNTLGTITEIDVLVAETKRGAGGALGAEAAVK